MTKVLGLRKRLAERRAERRRLRTPEQVPATEAPDIEIAPNDPILAYFQSAAGPVDIEALNLDSPAATALKEAGVKLVIPLVAQGELIGLLNLGPRLSEQEYSADDRKLLENLAAQAAPALRVAQLVKQQEAEARVRERVEQEMKLAQLIQQQFLPKELPEFKSWQVSAYYRPAREVGGDFYDFIELPDGRVGVVVGDVTDKGVPAALVMATTRSILRTEAPRLISPGKVLQRANDLLVPDIPAQMFVTCLYAVLDPETGRMQYANAGHNLPYIRTSAGAVELKARGMPLGLMEGMTYEEKECVVGAGENVLLHSDGVAEAHNIENEMFGFPRLLDLVGRSQGGDELIDSLLGELASFTGATWEQEDDITLVSLWRAAAPGMAETSGNSHRVLASFTLESRPGNEREAISKVVEAVDQIGLSPETLERVKTAVGEATMNAIEHGNQNDPALPVDVEVVASHADVAIRISDLGGDDEMPEVEVPDLEAKLAGTQTARGWGLFLIKNMVDGLQTSSDGSRHTIELTFHLQRS